MAKIKITVGRHEYTSYSKAVQQEFGLTKEEYTKQYDVFKHRVRNYVRATGDTKLSAAREFFFSLAYKRKLERNLELIQTGRKPLDIKKPHILMVLERQSSRTGGELTERDKLIASEQIQYRFAAMAEKNGRAKEVMEKLKENKIAPKEAKDLFDKISDDMREYKDAKPDEYASDYINGSL